jgi:predicted DNA-binding transcriptional regulator AlpA
VNNELLDFNQVVALTKLSRRTIDRREGDGLFPRRQRVGKKAMWKASEIQAWLEVGRERTELAEAERSQRLYAHRPKHRRDSNPPRADLQINSDYFANALDAADRRRLMDRLGIDDGSRDPVRPVRWRL